MTCGVLRVARRDDHADLVDVRTGTSYRHANQSHVHTEFGPIVRTGRHVLQWRECRVMDAAALSWLASAIERERGTTWLTSSSTARMSWPAAFRPALAPVMTTTMLAFGC
jgi:hypothetical protein